MENDDNYGYELIILELYYKMSFIALEVVNDNYVLQYFNKINRYYYVVIKIDLRLCVPYVINSTQICKNV